MADSRQERSPIELRRERKQANRAAMVAAASRLFASSGFAGTTMEAVASGSEMSVQSVYFAFGSKAALLREAIERATPPPGGRVAEPDAERALALLVGDAVAALEATGPLALAAAAAAPGEPAVAEVRDWYDSRRSRAAADLVQQLRRRRALAQGVTPGRAADVVYAVLSPQLHALLVQERGWSSKRFARWATGVVGRALWG